MNNRRSGGKKRDLKGLAHDMRTPLSVVKGFLEVVKVKEGSSEAEFCGAAWRSLEKLMGLVDSMRSFETQGVHECDFAFRTKTVVNDLFFVAKQKGVEIEYAGPENLHCSLDAFGMERVIQNLLTNAVQACDGGDRVCVKLSASGDMICLEVGDNGCGIEPKHLPFIFERGFTHGKADGTGLGLDVCKAIVEDHGGRIDVSSQKDCGTVFIVVIPDVVIDKDAGLKTHVPSSVAGFRSRDCGREDTMD